jgi:mycofactocin precursor
MTVQIATPKTSTFLRRNGGAVPAPEPQPSPIAVSPAPAPAPAAERPQVTVQDVLVEEVSIDGMCGVY